MQFDAGSRVRVADTYHWAKGAQGIVALPPEPVRNLEAWHGCHRTVAGVSGPILFYWVEFDEPQHDADGDGPYRAGEIDCAFLEAHGRAS